MKNLIKSIVFKALKIETPEEKYLRLAKDHESNKKKREENREKIRQLAALHNSLPEGKFKEDVAGHIEIIVSKQKAVEETLAQNEIIISMLKNTLHSKGHIV